MENGKWKMGRRIGSFELGLADAHWLMADGLWLLGGSEVIILRKKCGSWKWRMENGKWKIENGAKNRQCRIGVG